MLSSENTKGQDRVCNTAARSYTGPRQSFHSLCVPNLPAQGFAPRPLYPPSPLGLLMFC